MHRAAMMKHAAEELATKLAANPAVVTHVAATAARGRARIVAMRP